MGKCCSVCEHNSSRERDLESLPQQTTTSLTSNQLHSSGSQHKPKLAKSSEKGFFARPGNGSHDILRTIAYPKQELDETKILSLFSKYKDDTEDAILADGMEKFCQDLGVDPTAFVVLVLAWKFNASQMCRFTKEEFINGCKEVRADSIKGLQNKLPELEDEVVGDTEKFKDLYRFTFKFGLDVEDGQRSLPTNIAVALWKLIFSKDMPVVIGRWFAYLNEREVKGISRDTWNMFLNFTESIASDFSNYDDSEAWPSLFDDFVESEREKSTNIPNDQAEEKHENGVIKEF
ncbi:DCN1-like protein 3 [Exaiptasia diaphana]|uniref:Defective in cullin neddylation protein n=1 Tax=Exaiptasia diaphana TaxID=2652724 RepID=A0A913Y7P4_EXADI|nr:DCN1-like protein 3 [Exaiptasia diaphana]KXJ21724.1 DCN1-like protein 3 [Exaiptasia diaphana]